MILKRFRLFISVPWTHTDRKWLSFSHKCWRNTKTQGKAPLASCAAASGELDRPTLYGRQLVCFVCPSLKQYLGITMTVSFFLALLLWVRELCFADNETIACPIAGQWEWLKFPDGAALTTAALLTRSFTWALADDPLPLPPPSASDSSQQSTSHVPRAVEAERWTGGQRSGNSDIRQRIFRRRKRSTQK